MSDWAIGFIALSCDAAARWSGRGRQRATNRAAPRALGQVAALPFSRTSIIRAAAVGVALLVIFLWAGLITSPAHVVVIAVATLAGVDSEHANALAVVLVVAIGLVVYWRTIH